LLEKLASGEAVAARAPAATGPAAAEPAPMLQASSAPPQPQPAPPATPNAPPTFRDLVESLATGGKPYLAQQLHDYCGLVRYVPPQLVLRPTKPLSGDFIRDLAAALKALTGATWQVEASDVRAEPTLLEQEQMAAENVRQSVLDSPMVKAALEAFPDAELAGYTLDDQRSA
jgi:DNA polymerase-3 subunit gamma/tau